MMHLLADSRRSLLLVTGFAICASAALPAVAWAAFSYKPAGELTPGSGKGLKTSTIYAPNMRFPIEKAPAFLNSQVWGVGGMNGPSGSQCSSKNYSYPWWDNYCETRSWSMPLCPAGKGHQGQDMRASTCEKNKHWTVAAEDGTITSIGTYSVYLKAASGITYRYLHLEPSSLVVKVGNKVKKGAHIGKVSNAFGGTPTSIHLHFDVQQYVKNVGTVFVSPYLSLVKSYQTLIGASACDDKACAAKSSCGAWGKCGGFASACDESGTQKRTCTVYACKAGKCESSQKEESKACTVDTDGKVVQAWTAWSACGGFSGPCDTSGSQTRTQQVCKAGKAVADTQKQTCSQKTDGKVVAPWTAWSACAGFDGPCDQTGSQSRSQQVCQGGQATTQTEQQTCKQDTDLQVVEPFGAWGPCGGFSGPCDETGTQTRSQKLCAAGQVVTDVQTQACTQSTAGKVLEDWGPWSPCAGFDGPCDATGSQDRSRVVCSGGAAQVETEAQACTQVVVCGLPDAAAADAGDADAEGDAGDDAAAAADGAGADLAEADAAPVDAIAPADAAEPGGVADADANAETALTDTGTSDAAKSDAAKSDAAKSDAAKSDAVAKPDGLVGGAPDAGVANPAAAPQVLDDGGCGAAPGARSAGFRLGGGVAWLLLLAAGLVLRRRRV